MSIEQPVIGKFCFIFWIGFCISLGGRLGQAQAALAPVKLYQKVLPSVMTLEVESLNGQKYVGTAVLARGKDIALTAWHVVADARSVWAVFADGQRVRVAGCIDHNGARDVAILKLERPLRRQPAAISSELEVVASRAYVIGAPKGYDFSISDGLVSQVRTIHGFLQYQLSCPISPGNSGSPILNENGAVIGIASWTKTDAQNVSFAIPIREFLQFDVAQQPRSWDEMARCTVPTSVDRANDKSPVTGKASHDGADTKSYQEFLDLLKCAAGNSVTVILQQAAHTNTFVFTAP